VKPELLLPAVIAAMAAIGGVVYGGRLTERRERRNWLRDQRLTAYAELANAVERCWGAFQLVNAGLALRAYDLEAVRTSKDSKIFVQNMEEWAIWVAKVEDCLPRARLVASDRIQSELFKIDMVVCSVQRDVFMHMNYLSEVKEKRWNFVNNLTLDAQFSLRKSLRADLHSFDKQPSRLGHTFRRVHGVLRRLRRRDVPGAQTTSRRPMRSAPTTGAECATGTEPPQEAGTTHET
jgi:hypothetical protein